VHRNKFIYIKTNRRTDFANLFWLKNEPIHFSGTSSARHQEFVNCTVGTGMSYGLKSAYEQGRPGPARKLTYIPVPSVQLANS